MDEHEWQESYEMVRDAIIEHFDPADDDIAEPAIMVGAIEDVAAELKEARYILADIRELLIVYSDKPSAVYRGEIESRIEQVIGPREP